MLGRKSPFPLILLPQFGGYWIEGMNHELSDTADCQQLQPLSPTTRTKLECNASATIFRKHFLGKVSTFVQHRAGEHTTISDIMLKKCYRTTRFHYPGLLRVPPPHLLIHRYLCSAFISSSFRSPFLNLSLTFQKNPYPKSLSRFSACARNPGANPSTG